jgi:hypothetical protein
MSHSFDTIGKLLMNRGPLSWFHNVLTYDEKVIEYSNFHPKNSFKSKLKFIRVFGCTLGIVGKPSMSRI